MFSENEKIKVFDEIYNLYFNKNFGSTTKADLELLLFSEYLNNRIKDGEPYDDYSLSKELGITQSRIRALKERKELKYSYAYENWRSIFANSLKNAKYDSADHHIKVLIEDVNVLNEIRHLIEENGWYDDCSLNRKLLNIPLGCFVDICIEDSSVSSLLSDETKKKLKKISLSESAIGSFLNEFTKDSLKSFLGNASRTAICEVLKLLPFGGIAKTAFDFILKVIQS